MNVNLETLITPSPGSVERRLIVTSADGFVTNFTVNVDVLPAGSTSTFTVKLVTKPSADVTINLRSTDPGEGVISVSKLTFTGSNYSTAQTVTVTGVDDTLARVSSTPVTVTV